MICPRSIQLRRRKFSQSRRVSMQQDKLQCETFISATFRLNSSFPTSLRGREARNLLNAENLKREIPNFEGWCHFFGGANTGGYFSRCLSSVGNLFKFPDFAFSSGRGELSCIGGIPTGIRHMHLVQREGGREATAGFQLRQRKNTWMQKQDLRNGLKTWILSFNVFVNDLSRGALTKSKYTATHQKVWDTKRKMKMSSQHDRPEWATREFPWRDSAVKLSIKPSKKQTNKQKKQNTSSQHANFNTKFKFLSKRPLQQYPGCFYSGFISRHGLLNTEFTWSYHPLEREAAPDSWRWDSYIYSCD